MKTVEFKEIKIGGTFFIQTEDYNRISQCVKIADLAAQEIFGDKFLVMEDELVMVEG